MSRASRERRTYDPGLSLSCTIALSCVAFGRSPMLLIFWSMSPSCIQSGSPLMLVPPMRHPSSSSVVAGSEYFCMAPRSVRSIRVFNICRIHELIVNVYAHLADEVADHSAFSLVCRSWWEIVTPRWAFAPPLWSRLPRPISPRLPVAPPMLPNARITSR